MKILRIRYLQDYKIEVEYEDGQTHTFDFEKTINDFVNKYGKFQELLNFDYFKNVKFNEDWNTIEWPNGFDICPDLMQPQYAIA